MSLPYEEERDFDVEVSVTFRTNVHFSKMLRASPITPGDAYNNFMGCGLEDILNAMIRQGEYGITITDLKVTES